MITLASLILLRHVMYNILLMKSQLFCLMLQKQPLDLTVFHTGYLKNVLQNFVIYAHDFKVVGLLNSALKYADDFTLIVHENTDVSAEDENKECRLLLWSDEMRNVGYCCGLMIISCQLICQNARRLSSADRV